MIYEPSPEEIREMLIEFARREIERLTNGEENEQIKGN